MSHNPSASGSDQVREGFPQSSPGGTISAREVGPAASAARYRLLAEHTDDLVSVQDAHGRRVYVSPSHLTVLGYRAEELLGQSLASEVHPEDAPLLVQAVAQARREVGSSARTVCRLQHCDGSWRWVDAMVTAIPAQGGVLLVGRDVTHLRALEGQLHQAQKMELIGRLAGGVAHDFNNLLVVISGCAELGSLALPPVHPVQSDLKEIQQAALRATALTRQLLTLARRQQGEPRRLDLNALITDMARLLRRLVRENVQLQTTLAPALRLTRVDPGQLEQVIMNLVVNAHDAMPRGGQLGVVTANVTLPAPALPDAGEPPAGDYVQLDVTDTGTGMTAEVQRHLFRVFFSTKAPERGTGLGLWTCHEIVKQHGGYILVDSAVGRGTCVRILLPAVRGAADRPAELGVAQRGALGSETVLLVEDEPLVRGLASRVLREHGYTVHEAAEGRQALQLLEQGLTVALVVTDLVMPTLDGSSLASEVWARHPQVRVLFMSGYADNALDASQLGPQAAFLQKPFTARALAQQVRALLDR